MRLKTMMRKEPKLEDLKEVLNKFEQGEDFHKFRNTAIYHSVKHNYDLHLQKSEKQSSSKVS
jgi:hypothetical protein